MPSDVKPTTPSTGAATAVGATTHAAPTPTATDRAAFPGLLRAHSVAYIAQGCQPLASEGRVIVLEGGFAYSFRIKERRDWGYIPVWRLEEGSRWRNVLISRLPRPLPLGRWSC